MAGSLSGAAAGPEATLQVLAAAGRVGVRTCRETQCGGHRLDDERRDTRTRIKSCSQRAVSFKCVNKMKVNTDGVIPATVMPTYLPPQMHLLLTLRHMLCSWVRKIVTAGTH